MRTQLSLVLLPEEAADESRQLQLAAQKLSIPKSRIKSLRLLKRSIDARGRQVRYHLTVEVFIDEFPLPTHPSKNNYAFNRDVSSSTPVLIAGFGPAGMFAALKLIECGLKPVIIERGKDVRQRRRDLAAINKLGKMNGDSNYCYGEGGAGTYSDGKLYTRSNKRGNIQRILDILMLHGADSDIRVNAHPHIGTNKLPVIVEAIRRTILNAGGEIYFNTRLEDLIITDHTIVGVKTFNLDTKQDTEIKASNLILATGHSARNIYEMLYRNNISIDAKPFALGVRIEHDQSIIDTLQYHCDTRGDFLPPASYSLKHQFNGRGIYSFCMCPGGIIAPAATAEGEIVVNGWSPSRRNNPFANSGIVVEVTSEDFKKYKSMGPLAGLAYQHEVEQKAFAAGRGNLKAPAQRMIDFIEGRISATLPPCSYLPGVTSCDLDGVLPAEVSSALKNAFIAFGRKMKSYYTNDAILVGVESRTSSPVRIPRNPQTLMHPEITGLFPCGEGAGYAGGIVSAAMDGERIAEEVVQFVNSGKY